MGKEYPNWKITVNDAEKLHAEKPTEQWSANVEPFIMNRGGHAKLEKRNSENPFKWDIYLEIEG